jgi:cytochrome c biogenesis protein CcdA
VGGFGAIAALSIATFLLVNAYAAGDNFLQKMQNSSVILPIYGGAVLIILGLLFGKDIIRKIWPLT